MGPSYPLPLGLGSRLCFAALPPGLSASRPLTPWGWWLQSSPGPARVEMAFPLGPATAVFVVCVLKRFL